MSANPNDMIIIIGSTFGATGKAGICEVLNEFKNRQLLQHLYKAVVLVEPYLKWTNINMMNHFIIVQITL